MQSAKFAKVKAYFDRGLWTLGMARNAVYKAWITAAEFEEITGEMYAGA